MTINGYELIVVKIPQRFEDGQTVFVKEVAIERMQQGYRQIVLDFSDVAYIDSAGLATLVSINKTATKMQSTVVIRGLNENIRDFFRRTYLDQVLNVVD